MRLFRLFSIQLCILVSAVVFVGAFAAAPALAVVPVFTVNTVSVPTDLPPGGEGKLLLEVDNLGDTFAFASGETNPIVIADRLPAGLTATSISIEEPGTGCELATLRCEYASTLPPYHSPIQVEIRVKVAKGTPGTVFNEVSVSGGGAASIHVQEALTVSPTPAGFGVGKLKLLATNEDGSVDTQAGSHPFQLTTTFGVTNRLRLGEESNLSNAEPFALTKDLHFVLPAGLVGNPEVIPQCTGQEFDAVSPDGVNGCPAETAIGVATVRLGNVGLGEYTTVVPLFNLVPSVGEPARFGFSVAHVPVILDTSVRTGGDYGVVVSVNNISQIFPFFGSQVTFWGVPADPRHNLVRGWGCLDNNVNDFEDSEEYRKNFLPPCVAPGQPKLTPFLTLPTSCEGPAGMRTTVQADSWSEPGVFKEAEYTPNEGTGELLGLDGCNRLPFAPSISVAPDGPAASTPTGLTVGVHVPQTVAVNPTGLAPSDLRNTTVTLPAGIQISPAGAGGLEACSLEQIALEKDSSPTCPNAAKIGTVEIKTPLLPEALEGAAYLAAPQNFAGPLENPFGSLVALYIVAEDPKAGVVVKFAGKVTMDPVTGQLVTTFENTPKLPFEELRLHFFGSGRAPLSTPPLCGTYTTQASFAPWSGNEPATPSSSFEITSGPNGGPCEDPLPFAPTLTAGTTSIQAGGFSPFTMTMSREDGDQNLKAIQLHMPPGLLGTLSTVKLCPEPQADEGTCGPESLIGTTTVSVGLGGDPFTVEGGQVFITGPYDGAPYGLSIVNPAVAGPFNLGKVVVRARIEVNPTTAALTITTDGSGPYKIPTIIDGIPLEIKHINVSIDRPGFTFNATNCSKLAITGTLESSEGGVSAPLSVPYQVTNCAVLAFKPQLTALTSGKTSRANGASFHVKLGYPAGPYDANISKVKVELPKALPSRLTTLQKACTAAVFNANPAACPPASIVGQATASTPVLPVPLSGPAYFVSHGGEAFPSLVIVLQGYGVTVHIVGSTFIDKAGITSSTFKAVPDVPVGTFELTLPEGPFSALAANGNLCKEKLAMPTEFVGQNGALIKTSTKIAVTGCGKTKKTKKAKHTKKGGHRRKRKK